MLISVLVSLNAPNIQIPSEYELIVALLISIPEHRGAFYSCF